MAVGLTKNAYQNDENNFTMYYVESLLNAMPKPVELLSGRMPENIIIKLKEGGYIVLQNTQ